MSKNRIGIILLLLLLTVGFATVTANLIINNSVSISARPDDFVVYFSKAIAEDGGTAEISNDKKVITYSTKELKQVGDRAELDYRVTNDSHQYDANVDIDISFDDTYSNYLSMSFIGFNNTDSSLVEARSYKEGKIIIELLKPVVDDMNISFTITMDVDAIERSNIAETVFYNLSFNSNGGPEYDSRSIESGHSVGELPTPTKKGNSFAGWYMNDYEVNSQSLIDGDETIEAHWNRNRYNLSIDLAGGESSQDLTHSVLYEDELELIQPTKTDNKFKGWDVTGEDSIVSDNIFKMGIEDSTVTAKWARKLTVTFNSNGGSAVPSKDVWEGELYGTLPKPSRSGYVFAGWWTTASGGTNIKSTTTVETVGTQTLYAIWISNSYFYESERVGDYVETGGRRFTRTSNQLALLGEVYYPGRTDYMGFTIISNDQGYMGGTPNGQYSYLGISTYTSPQGNPIYVGFMASAWPVSNRYSTTVVANGVGHTVSTLTPINSTWLGYLDGILYK